MADLYLPRLKVANTQVKVGTQLLSTSGGSDLVGHNTLCNVGDFFDHTANRGLLTGCIVTDEGGLHIHWTAGEIYDIVTQDAVAIDAGEGNCADGATNYLMWVSGATLTLGVTQPSGTNNLIARISTQDSDIVYVKQALCTNEITAGMRRGLRKLFPVAVSDGLIVSADTDITNVWDVVSSEGTFVKDGTIVIPVSGIVSRTTAMVRWFHASSVWDSDTNAQIDTTKYDPGTDLAAVTASKYYKSVFMICNDKIQWIYPRVAYNTEAEAIAGTLPTIPPGLSFFPQVTALVLRGNAAAFPTAGSQAWIDIRPRVSSSVAGAITDHGALAGLEDDDHTQYALKTTVGASLKSNGGLVLESTALSVDLGASSITGTLAVADGGTGSSTAAGAVTNLGLDPMVGMDVVGGRIDIESATALRWTFLNSNQIRLYNTSWELVKLAAQPTLANTDVDLNGDVLTIGKIYDVFAEYGTSTALANTNKLTVSYWMTTGTGGNSSRTEVYDAGTTYKIGNRVTYGGHDWVKISAAAAGTTPVAGAAWTDNGVSVGGDFAGLYKHEGVLVEANSAAGKKRRWLGIILITYSGPTANFADTEIYGYISNFYNRRLTRISSYNTTASWTYATNTWRECNAGTGQIRGNFVNCVSNNFIIAQGSATASQATNQGYVYAASCLNSVTPTIWSFITLNPTYADFGNINLQNMFNAAPGYNYVTIFEKASEATATLYSTSGEATRTSILLGL